MKMCRLIAVFMVVFAAPVLAGTCQFELECFEDEACAETDLRFEVKQNPEKPAQMQMITDAETLQGVGFRRDGPRHVVFFGDTAAHLLTIYANKSARYSAHLDGVLGITYHGTCEGID